jgi:ABC-type transport system involved in multi-copper enzyme maturation permease subunit
LRVPPVALFYGWVTMTLAPIFAVLTSSDAVSSDVASGAVRFAVARSDRAAFALGKLLGQTALSGVSVALGALGAWITGFAQLASFAPFETALFIGRYGVVCFAFAFAHLGLAVGVSQLTRSVPWSRALGLLGLAAVFAIHGLLGLDAVRSEAPAFVDSIRQLFPAAHRLDLFRPDLADAAPALLVLVAMGFFYFAAPLLRFQRRDL